MFEAKFPKFRKFLPQFPHIPEMTRFLKIYKMNLRLNLFKQLFSVGHRVHGKFSSLSYNERMVFRQCTLIHFLTNLSCIIIFFQLADSFKKQTNEV